MKVAFVVQRYGKEVNGGSEFLCRQIAERMAKHWELEVLTTCALEYTTWQNHYPPGLCEINGVRVRRFQVDYPRSTLFFNRLSDAVFSEKTSPGLQSRWVEEQGPYSSEFLRHLGSNGSLNGFGNGSGYDVFFFFTYLYGLTVLGLPRVAQRSILVPTAHDEPPFHLPPYEAIFKLPRALLFQTWEEQDLVLKKFALQTPNQVVSVGIESPESIPLQEFRNYYREQIKGSYILYLGRIDESKGCQELFRGFIQYREKFPEQKLQLILAGKSVMQIPQHPDICHLGFIEDRFKYAALAGAQVLVMPSPYESLSLVLLEAWNAGTPVLVNGNAPVLRGQCQRSSGGFWYQNEAEFMEKLGVILGSESLQRELGEKGRTWVRQHYSWDAVEKSYLDWAKRVGNRA